MQLRCTRNPLEPLCTSPIYGSDDLFVGSPWGLRACSELPYCLPSDMMPARACDVKLQLLGLISPIGPFSD